MKHEHKFVFDGGAPCPHTENDDIEVDTAQMCGIDTGLIYDVPVYCSQIVEVCECGASRRYCPDEPKCPFKNKGQ